MAEAQHVKNGATASIWLHGKEFELTQKELNELRISVQEAQKVIELKQKQEFLSKNLNLF